MKRWMVGPAVLVCCVGRVDAAIIFFYSFDGPQMNPAWIGSSFPGNPGSSTYAGPLNYSFGTIDGNTVLRCTDELAPYSYKTLVNSTVFSPQTFQYQVRFNTLTQSAATSIDGFVGIFLGDPGNSNYAWVDLFGANYSANKTFAVGGPNSFWQPSFDYLDNTWYRLVLAGGIDQDVTASLLSDSGATLASCTVLHWSNSYSSGLQLGVYQVMGSPAGPAPVDVAIDYVQLIGSTNAVPEPSTLAMFLGFGGMGLVAAWRRRKQTV